jgi:hypothetical protein
LEGLPYLGGGKCWKPSNPPSVRHWPSASRFLKVI